MSIDARWACEMRSGISRAELEEQFAEWSMVPAERPTPKRKLKPEESLHLAAAGFLRRAIAHEGTPSPACAMWWSYEAAHQAAKITTRSGKKISVESIRRKARGCVAGLCDVNFLYAGRYYGIELKRPKGGVLSPAQKAHHEAVFRCGGEVAVCLSLEAIEAALRAWGIPLRASVA